MQERIEPGHLVFVADGEAAIGAVRQVAPHGKPRIVIYVENAGEFAVPLTAVAAVHAHKVILSADELEPRLREAIGHAHDAEEPEG